MTSPTRPQPRTERPDFQESSDPALLASSERAEVNLLSYRDLYLLWERQQWLTQDIDFSLDRTQWHEEFDDQDRLRRLYGLASFFLGEQRVTDELGPIARAAPTEEMRLFLSTQVADEARHVAFFDRFYHEVGVTAAQDLGQRIAETRQQVSGAHDELFGAMLGERVQRLSHEPEDQLALTEAVTIYHMVIEGTLALTGQHFIISYNEAKGTLPGFVDGFTFVARDEHRHVAFGTRFLRDMVTENAANATAIRRVLEVAVPLAREVLRPRWLDDVDDDEVTFMFPPDELQAFADKALSRRLKVIRLGSA